MASASPDTARVLALVAHRDGQLTVSRLAHLLDPWPASPIPHVPGALQARRDARRAHHGAARHRVRSALGRLVRDGLVARVGSVELWPDARERWLETGADSLQRLGPISAEDEWLAPTPLVAPSAHAVAIVEGLLDGPMMLRDLAEATGGKAPDGTLLGAWRWAYRLLCQEQVVRPPRARRLTEEGRARLLAGRAV